MGVESRTPLPWRATDLRSVLLVLLTTQTTASILLLHYSRIMPPIDSHRYLPSTAVFLSELLKLALCLTISLTDISRTLPASTPATSLFSALISAVFSGDSWKMAVPAVLYTLSNSLTYVGVGNLAPGTFMVVWQVRVLVTAVGSKILLGRGLSARRWGALVLLAVGVGIVVTGCAGQNGAAREEGMVESTRLWPKSLEFLGLVGSSSTSKRMVKRSATYEGIAEDEMLEDPALNLNTSLGVLATSLAAICSGIAAVYFERILKDSVTSASPSLWIRNVQLAVYSLFPALFIGVVFLDGELIAKSGFFQGWSWVVWVAVSAQALGGIVAAFTVYYADCVIRNFATGVAIVASSVAGVWFFGGEVSGNFFLGATIVLISTFLYSHDHQHAKPRSHSTSRPPPIRISSNEKPSLNAEDLLNQPQDFSIKLPTTPLINEELGRSTSRPGSPAGGRHHARVGTGNGSYFGKMA